MIDGERDRSEAKELLTREQLGEWAEHAKAVPLRPQHYETGHIEVYEGSLVGQSQQKAVLIDPLRINARARLQVVRVPLDIGHAQQIFMREGAIDMAAVQERLRHRIEPIIIAQKFYGPGRDEIIDGNHTYVALAMSVEYARQTYTLPDDAQPGVDAYVCPPDLWKDFAADPATHAPLYGPSIARRLRGIDNDLPEGFFRIGRSRPKLAGAGRR